MTEAVPTPDGPAPDPHQGIPGLLGVIAEAVPGAVFSVFEPRHGPRQDVAVVDRENLVAFVGAARNAGFETFIDLCAVDHLNREPRFEIVIVLLSMEHQYRLRISVGVPGDDPVVPTITGEYVGANFYEREAWDLFGIRFTGHPDLTRLVLPDDWHGHPLRKDYAVGSVPVQFKEAPRAS